MKNIYVEFADETLMTYNDIVRDNDGEHIAVYFERPCDDGFCFLETSYPDLDIADSEGYSTEEIKELLAFAADNEPLVWEMARELQQGGKKLAYAV